MTDLFTEISTIKCLSLWQPWASLMAAGVKLHETRAWSTRYRGPIAIHAAKTIDPAGAPEDLCAAALGKRWRQTIPIGMVLAVGELTACVLADRLHDRLTPADQAAGNFGSGRFALRVDDLRPLTAPIPAVGRQGLFNWRPPEDLGARLKAILDHDAACRYIGWGRAKAEAA